MNALEKIFTSIRTSTSKQMKLFGTEELINQLSEYEDYSLFILKNIYSLVTSDIYLNRVCGAKLLRNLKFFSYEFDFKLSSNPAFTDYVYLQFKDINDSCLVDTHKQREEIKKKLSLEHVESDFLEEKDIEKIAFNIKLNTTSEVKEKEITNIYDFFEALNMILLSPDWNKRHGAFMAYSAIVASEDSSIDFDRDMKISEQSDENANGNSGFITNQESLEDGNMNKNDNMKKFTGNRTKILLTGDLFNKIFEILKNDKFNDFQEDVTSSPVREAACVLLKYIYPMVNNSLILHEVTHLLSSTDWQQQFSALLALSQLKQHFTQDLVDGKNLIDNFFQILIDLLESNDEDIKFLSANLISFIIDKFIINLKLAEEIKSKCWEQIEDDIDIAHSKASILILLKTIYTKFDIPHPTSFTSLYPCFTSCTSIVRDGVFELSKIFEAEEFLYLLGESILLETKNQFNHLQILRNKIDKLKTVEEGRETLKRFGEHFIRIISLSLYSPYRVDDFAIYDDSFFTPDGIKSIGTITVMNNRSYLLSELIQIPEIAEFTLKSILSDTFKYMFINYYKKKDQSDINTDNISSKFDSNPLSSIILNNLETEFKKYDSLRKMPIKEFLKIIQEFGFHSLFPLAQDHCLELVRKLACEFIFEATDFSIYFQLEKSDQFMSLFCKILINSPHIETITNGFVNSIFNSDQMLRKIQLEKSFEPPKQNKKANSFLKGPLEDDKSHQELMHDLLIQNIQIFFKILGDKFVQFSVFKNLLQNQEKLSFFKYTVNNYLNTESITPIFYEALEKKNVHILKAFISNIEYNSIFVLKMLDSFDLFLVSSLIEYSDPSFNVLFVKLILKNISSSSAKICDKCQSKTCNCPSLSIDIRTLLSTVICSLHFAPNRNIKNQKLIEMIEKEKKEVMMIVDPTLIEEYKIKIPVTIDLRDYQKEGIKWISFLSRFNLNGILADDMGLGKTVQMLCFVLNEMYLQGLSNVDNNAQLDLLKANDLICKSSHKTLIVCPSSLTSHWKDEIQSFFNVKSHIFDNKKESMERIIICSYDTLRRDNGYLENQDWFMVIFDEGHLLKNRNTVLFSKAKKLNAQKRFILTGTPIHNTVEDLFSLFDVIMPGYLGNESSFTQQYGCKITDKNVEVMKARLQSLHRKVLPFIMRRLKSEVLKDLPPKIITDVGVDMNQQQTDLYNRISNGEDGDRVTEIDSSLGYSVLKSSSLVTLKNCLKVAAHPHYFDQNVNSSKTAALQDLMSISGTSKMLIFFQFRSTIDFVLNDLNITNYLRLDGSIPPNQRGEIVKKFNTEDIPYLFLTTSIGGLGLNLTSANIVVFYEHDWNPFNDLQAMDRAHRLGQKMPVNVFRLICKKTLEETVMNYQNFKLYVANTVVTQQNNEILQMETKDILERFQ